jgi:hypothetical protein
LEVGSWKLFGRAASFVLTVLLCALGCTNSPPNFERLSAASPSVTNGAVTHTSSIYLHEGIRRVELPPTATVTYFPEEHDERMLELTIRKVIAFNGATREKFDARDSFHELGIMHQYHGESLRLCEFGTLSIGHRDVLRYVELSVRVPAGIEVVKSDELGMPESVYDWFEGWKICDEAAE